MWGQTEFYYERLSKPPRIITGPATAAVTGTITSSATEADIVAGGKTIIVTLTGDTWVTAGAPFDAIRQDLIDGLDSAGSETYGWNNRVRDVIDVGTVARTSPTVVTITLPACAYNISVPETITWTLPASAIDGGTGVVASPTFTILATGGGGGGGSVFRSSIISAG